MYLKVCIQNLLVNKSCRISVARLQMTGIPDLGIRVDIMGRVLDPLLCVCLADIQSVGIGACMLCVFGKQS